MTNQCYLIDKILLSLKNSEPSSSEFIRNVTADVGFSQSYIYFLIDFALLCMKFNKLKTVTFSITSLKTNFAFIKACVYNDVAFWT